MPPTCSVRGEKQLQSPVHRIIAFTIRPAIRHHSITPSSSMWQKLKEQLPTVILTALLITGAAFWLHQKTVNDMAAREQAELAPLRDQNEALKQSADENRRQIEATNKLLKDAISKRSADMFMTEDEVNKLNQDKINALAEAVAKKVQPYNPLPKSPEEAEKMQNEQVDKVSSRMTEKIKPILDEMASDQ